MHVLAYTMITSSYCFETVITSLKIQMKKQYKTLQLLPLLVSLTLSKRLKFIISQLRKLIQIV